MPVSSTGNNGCRQASAAHLRIRKRNSAHPWKIARGWELREMPQKRSFIVLCESKSAHNYRLTTTTRFEHTVPGLKSARTDRFSGNWLRWSPQKLTLLESPPLENVTAVKVMGLPLKSLDLSRCTAITMPLTLADGP